MYLLPEMLRMMRDQWAPRAHLSELQLVKLQRQVKIAWDQTEFYRTRYEEIGFSPDQLQSLEDLQKLPVIERQDLRSAGHTAHSRDIKLKDCVWAQTSGSSGTPMRLPLTKQDKAHRVLKELRALSAHDYHPRDKMMIIIDPDDAPGRQIAVQKMGYFKREYVSIFDEVDEQIARLRHSQPDVLYSYASCLRILAERLQTSGGSIPKPKLVISAAEMLDADTRQMLRDTFGTDPVDFYGSMEFGWVGWQCRERHSYHINADCLIVECLVNGRPAKQDEEGELVITSLHSDAAPIIRYATGDVGRLTQGWCGCGRSLPLLVNVSGRIADCIVLPGGKVFSPYFVTCALNHVPGVRQFQVIQESEDTIRVKLLSPEIRVPSETVSRAIVEALGAHIDVVVEYTDDIPREPNGKYRVVKSQLAGKVG